MWAFVSRNRAVEFRRNILMCLCFSAIEDTAFVHNYSIVLAWKKGKYQDETKYFLIWPR